MVSQVAELTPSTAARLTGKRRRSSATTSSPRRCRPWSRSRTRSTSRATCRSRGSWGPSRSRRTSCRSASSASREIARASPALAPRFARQRSPRRQGRPGADRGRRQRRGEDRRVPHGEAAHLASMSTLVFLETHDSEPTKGSLGVLAKAASLGGEVAGVALGAGARDGAAKAGAHGAATVYVVEDAALDAPLPQPRVDALEAVVAESGAETVPSPARCSRPTSRRPRGAPRRRAQLGSRTSAPTAATSSASVPRSATPCSSTSAGRRRRASPPSAPARSTRSRRAAALK